MNPIDVPHFHLLHFSFADNDIITQETRKCNTFVTIKQFVHNLKTSC